MAVTKDIPEAFYLVLTFLLFVICMVVLLLIFLPKILMHREYSQMSEADQKKAMAASVRLSSGQIENRISGLTSSTLRLAEFQSRTMKPPPVAEMTPRLPEVPEARVEDISNAVSSTDRSATNRAQDDASNRREDDPLNPPSGGKIANQQEEEAVKPDAPVAQNIDESDNSAGELVMRLDDRGPSKFSSYLSDEVIKA